MREFSSLAAFAAHLPAIAAAEALALHHGLKEVAQLVEASAKAQIGFYQPEAGPFARWEDLAESTEAEKSRLGYPTDAPLLRDGKLRDSITHELSGLEAMIGSTSVIAEYQEFGTATIPPRPFIGPAAFHNKLQIQKIIGRAAVSGMIGGGAIHGSLGYDFKV